MKEKDRKRRKFDIEVRTQLDNAIYSFMYAIESHELKVGKDAEKHFTKLLFDEKTIRRCTKLIQKKEMTIKDLIAFARKIAEKSVKLAKKGETKTVSEKHVMKAIESTPKSEIWFPELGVEKDTK